MSIEAHLAELERRHRALEAEITEARAHPSVDNLEIVELKRCTLLDAKDEIVASTELTAATIALAAEVLACASISILGRGPAWLRAACPAQWSQAIHYTIPRRPTVATHQSRTKQRSHLRAGAKPGDHHHRGHQERR